MADPKTLTPSPVDMRVANARNRLRQAEEAKRATDATKDASVKEPARPILGVDRLRSAEFERIIHVATPGSGHGLEEMIDPAYWAHVGPKLKPYDRIEVRAEDGTYFAELLVLACDRTWAKVHVLNWWDLSTQDVAITEAAAASSKFEIKHTPGLRWHVIRKSDRQTMHKDCQTKAEAGSWLTEYLKTVDA